MKNFRVLKLNNCEYCNSYVCYVSHFHNCSVCPQCCWEGENLMIWQIFPTPRRPKVTDAPGYSKTFSIMYQIFIIQILQKIQTVIPFSSFMLPFLRERQKWNYAVNLKGQLISKGLFCVFNSSKKRTKNVCPSRLGQKFKFSSSFFGRIEDTQKTFRN